MYDTLLWDFPCLLNNDMTLIGRVFLSRGSGEALQLLESVRRQSLRSVIREGNYRRSGAMDPVMEGIEFEIFISIAAEITNSVEDVPAFKL